jgi:hypothetical protein
MKAMNIDRLAIVIAVLVGFVVASAGAQDSRPVSQLDATVLPTADAVTSEELDETKGNDPVAAPTAVLPLEARGVNLTLIPLNDTAPRNVLIRILPTAVTAAN